MAISVILPYNRREGSLHINSKCQDFKRYHEKNGKWCLKISKSLNLFYHKQGELLKKDLADIWKWNSNGLWRMGLIHYSIRKRQPKITEAGGFHLYLWILRKKQIFVKKKTQLTAVCDILLFPQMVWSRTQEIASTINFLFAKSNYDH